MALDPNEQPNPPIAKFESMLKTDDVYFFDAEDFEDIIHHYGLPLKLKFLGDILYEYMDKSAVAVEA